MTEILMEHIFERRGCPIHFWDGGVLGRPLVVFTHGACVDHHSFDPHIPAVAERYRVLAWDVRGHGLSQPMGAAFSLPEAVDDLLGILQMIGYSNAVFVGHSNGTYITQELAFRHPECVQALVVADGTCITWQHTALDRWILRASGDMMALFPYETLKKAGLSKISAKKSVQEYTYRAYSQISKADFIAIWKGLTQGLHSEPGYRIAQPLLLTHGADDATGDIRKIAPLWAAQTPRCCYEVIPDARHFAPLDQPEIFTRMVLGFLEIWAPV